MSDIEDLQTNLEENNVVITDTNFLFLDVSSTCTGYAIYELNFHTKRAKLKKSGCLWFNSKWDHQEKYSYLSNAISQYFWIVGQIDYLVHEAYSINMNQRQGVMVVPEMIGAVKAAAWENGVKTSEITPQTWRSQLKIKKEQVFNKDGTPKLNGTKKVYDWKKPTKDKILEDLQVPETMFSNITKKERTTPSDVYDAIAVGAGWLTKNGFKPKFTKDVKFNDHIGVLDELMA